MKKILLLLFISQLSFGQSKIRTFLNERKEKKRQRWATEHVYRTSGLALASQNFQQQVFSQNQFSGIGIGFFSNSLIDRPKNQRGFENSLNLIPSLQSANSLSSSYSATATVGYYFLKKINQNLAVGVAANALIGGRFNGSYDNNAISTEAVIELAPKMRYAKDFKFLKKDYSFNYTLSAAVVGLGLWTPTYTSNFTNIGRGVVLPNKYNHFDSRLMLQLPARKRFTNIRPTIGYGWNAYILNANAEDKIINATHSIYLIANFKQRK
ncbi:MAG: hypothetical protein ACOVO2_21110 [Emticicia sp.]|uniref:hypothetical protein n=1 Tax=Emticicia sp. TaxID=1930953 RepID=UPI003BA52212